MVFGVVVGCTVDEENSLSSIWVVISGTADETEDVSGDSAEEAVDDDKETSGNDDVEIILMDDWSSILGWDVRSVTDVKEEV